MNDRTDKERIAVLESRMDAQEKQGAETLNLVRGIHERITVSKGAMIGATTVLGGLVAIIAFAIQNAWHFFTAGPPPHGH